MKPVKILIVERTPIISEGLKGFLNDKNYELMTILKSVEELKSVQSNTHVDLIIIGINLRINVSPSLQEQLLSWQAGLMEAKSSFPNARIVVLLDQGTFSLINDPYEWGVDGYIFHENVKEAFINYLNLILIGEKVIPSMPSSMIKGNGKNYYNGPEASNANSRQTHVSFSERERDIIGYLAKGDSNKNIANQLNITESTVKVHLKAILRKLGVHNRTQVALWAVQQHTKIDPNNLSGSCMLLAFYTTSLVV